MTQREPQLELPLGGAPAIRPGAPAALDPGRCAPPDRWQDGARLPFLGHWIELRLDPAADAAELRDGFLYLPLPPHADESQVRDRAQGWLQAEARRVLDDRMTECARRLGIAAPRWLLSFAARFRGGIGPDGRLRLSWRLIHLAPAEIERVVMEPLALLRARAGARSLWDDAESLPA